MKQKTTYKVKEKNIIKLNVYLKKIDGTKKNK